MTDWKIAILPLIGVVLGAGLQHVLSRSAKKADHATQLQTEAYTDYLKAVALAGHLGSDDDLRNSRRNAADAKSRMSVYASSEVIKALADFERSGARIEPGKGENTFLALVKAMRSDSQDVSKEDLEIILFGADKKG